MVYSLIICLFNSFYFQSILVGACCAYIDTIVNYMHNNNNHDKVS